MFGKKKSGMGDVLGNILAEQLSKKDKYRKECKFCITAVNSPIGMSFCAFGCAPKGVAVILACPKDCGNFEVG
jgi:hypothetical protein